MACVQDVYLPHSRKQLHFFKESALGGELGHV